MYEAGSRLRGAGVLSGGGLTLGAAALAGAIAGGALQTARSYGRRLLVSVSSSTGKPAPFAAEAQLYDLKGTLLSSAMVADKAGARAELGLPDGPLVALMPGSRGGEVGKLGGLGDDAFLGQERRLCGS